MSPASTPYAARQRRAPLRRWLPLIVLLVVALEVAVFVVVGRLIGVGATVLLVLLETVVGAWLVRREGARAWRALTEAARSGVPPSREVADGALVLVGGVLLLVPGLVTDVLGLLLVLPVTRALARPWLAGFVARSLVVAPTSGASGPGASRGASRGPDVVEGKIVD